VPERPLLIVDPADWRAVHAALRARLFADGPAVFPVSDPGDAVPATAPAATALVIQTSGSTGRPKRVALGEAALRASAHATETALGGPGQWLVCLSPAFVAGSQQLVRSLLGGTEPVAGPLDGFDPAVFAAGVAEMTADRRYSALVPAQLSRLVGAGEHDAAVRTAVSALDAILIGGQALPQAVALRARELGYRIIRTYGSSETATGCVYDGRPVGATRLRTVDGVLEISGPTLAEGYLGDADATAAAFHVEDGVRWFRTAVRGDLRPVAGRQCAHLRRDQGVAGPRRGGRAGAAWPLRRRRRARPVGALGRGPGGRRRGGGRGIRSPGRGARARGGRARTGRAAGRDHRRGDAPAAGDREARSPRADRARRAAPSGRVSSRRPRRARRRGPRARSRRHPGARAGAT